MSENQNTGRVAGVDYGTVRVGLAISDPERKIASPWENYTRKNKAADARFFKSFVAEQRVSLFVVGLPVHLSGDESEKSKEARVFGAWLEAETGVPVRFFDERFSSRFADELMAGTSLTAKKRKERRDKLAAYVVLSAWLESSRKKMTAGTEVNGTTG